MENKQHLVSDSGTRDSTTWEFDGIRMGHALSKFKEYTRFEATSVNTDVVRLHIGLAGNYSFEYRQLGTSFDLIGGHHNIMYSKDFDMVVHNRTLELETFGVQFPRELFLQFTQNANDLLQRFAGHIMDGKSIILTDQWGAVDPPIQQVIYQIIHHRYTGDLQKLFLLSKSIELLVLCAESCNLAATHSAAGKKEVFIKSQSDKEKIIAVRDLINQRVHCPPNLSEIARSVGLNEYKLKRGFKETFNTTVFGYLTEQRLNLAHQYLRDTQKTAAEIYLELGYA